MKKQIGLLPAIWGAIAMLILIFDGKTALISAQEGIKLCLRTVIPSLFPFFVLSGVISSTLLGRNIKVLRPIGKLCRIPAGSESLLLLGLIAGYPVGAQMIADASQHGYLPRKDRTRMLGFCCNAGPAFLFGMLAPLFTNSRILWVLWGVHIASALLVGILLPGKSNDAVKIPTATPLSISDSLGKGVKTMSLVCGWVVAFRVLLGFCERWILWAFPAPIGVLLSGLLELSNGCVQLSRLSSEGLRFVLAGIFLSLGGVCVYMQTKSVTGQPGTGWYLPGKVLQSLISLLICLILQKLLFSATERFSIPISALLIIGAITILIAYGIHMKLGMEKKARMLYNIENLSTKESDYAISQKC